ncbi:MAG: RNA-binding transcriptional accessory protein [Clostridia bacterium]|nr:RNA-binding transcriptional accessory protein [Clostridia bacterium]
MDILNQLKLEFSLTDENLKKVVNLLDDGNTIPFIARYRKELTGHIDDQVLRQFSDRLEYLRNLDKRKEDVKRAINEQGKLTEEIETALLNAVTLTEVEDVYRPFKQKKKTRATVAVAKGLLPLAETFILQKEKSVDFNELCLSYINSELGVNSTQDAIDGAKDIIAEKISDDAELRKKLRKMFLRIGVISSTFVKGLEEDDKKAGIYGMYKDYSEPISNLKGHRVLALNRGESDDALKVKIAIDKALAVAICENSIIKGESAYAQILKESASDAYSRLIEPSIEREVRSLLTENAQERAIKTFETNLRPLLMQPPLKNKIVLGYDPGFRTGCKLAVVDETGKVLDKAVIYPTIEDEKKILNAKVIVKNLIKKYGVNVISIGNGTASKESEIFIANLIKEIEEDVSYIVVSEAGASVYSASELGAKEFPDYDVSERSAVSIARRLQDPLAELIKIDPKSIGVGQYQHDMQKSRLDKVLGGTVEDCVNCVGVDLNTASVPLLSYVAGLNSGVAKNIVEYREQNGKFKDRKELLKVSKLGKTAYTQCAGFLRILGGDNILDNTAVHPESYDGANKLLKTFGYTSDDVKNFKLANLPNQVKELGYNVVSEKCGLGVDTLKDVILELLKPGRDVREELPKPTLRSDILNINDLKDGMVITGTVRNVVDFGAFIDLGVHQDGLVHISEISDSYVKHPSDVLKVGQVLKVKIKSVDVKKNRIALTLKGIN